MLSAETLDLLQTATKMMYFSGASPLVWKKNKTGRDRLVLKDSKGYRTFTGLHFTVLILYYTFMSYRFVFALITHNHSQGAENKKEATLSAILQITWNLFGYSFPLLIMLNNFKFWKDVPTFINGFIECFEKFKGN